MLSWSEFSCVSGTIFVFSVPALHPPLSPHQSPTWTCSSSYPLACFYILAVASPPVPDRSACRGLCRVQTHTSCSSPVAPLFSVPERAIFLLLRWLLCFFFLTPAVLLLFVPPFVFSLKIFCHLPLQLFFALDFPVLSLCLIPVWLNLCSLTCTCCFSVSCVLGLASGFVIHHSYSFTVWSPHFCPG